MREPPLLPHRLEDHSHSLAMREEHVGEEDQLLEEEDRLEEGEDQPLEELSRPLATSVKAVVFPETRVLRDRQGNPENTEGQAHPVCPELLDALQRSARP